MKNWSSFNQEKKFLTYIQYGENGNLCISGVETLFHRRFSLLSAAMSMHFGTFISCFHAKMTNYYSTLLIVFSMPASVFPFTLLLMWCRRDHQSQGRGSNTSSSATGPPEPLCLPPWWWVGCQSSQHVIQRKEMVSSLSPVLWARARSPAAAALCTALACASACAYIANIPCHNILL